MRKALQRPMQCYFKGSILREERLRNGGAIDNFSKNTSFVFCRVFNGNLDGVFEKVDFSLISGITLDPTEM